MRREWAADWNIIRLHDAKHKETSLVNSTPVVCQKCHYSPALDLAHFGPVGPSLDANGKEQTIHRSNSRVMHAFHGNLDLFKVTMPKPNSPARTDPATGEPVVNARVQRVLNQTCYQCHPGQDTNCLRGAMFNGGLVCQDCHGDMKKVGNDFSAKFPTVPFPAGADLNKRIPWASEPGCQSCHTGDALTTLAQTDPNVIPAKDGIRLLQAYRTNDANATPISSPTSRFAENQVDGKRVLYRLSKDNHAGIFCQGCHGSTHAEWPVQPSSGTIIANDNQPAIQLQGHAGTRYRVHCVPPGGHASPVSGWPSRPASGQRSHAGSKVTRASSIPFPVARPATAKYGEGTVLAKAAKARKFTVEDKKVNISKDQLVGCGICHENPM